METETRTTTNEIKRFERRSGPVRQNTTMAYLVSLPGFRISDETYTSVRVDCRSTGLASRATGHLLSWSLFGLRVESRSAGR